MCIGAGLYMYDVVVKKFTFAISSPDEFLFNMSCLGVILQVNGRDGMSTLQNGACGCILTVLRITYLPGWFPIAFPALFILRSVLLLTAEAFL